MSREPRFWPSGRPWRSAGRLVRATDGATAMEYALIVALLALVIIGALGEIGDTLVELPLPALVNAFASVLS